MMFIQARLPPPPAAIVSNVAKIMPVPGGPPMMQPRPPGMPPGFIPPPGMPLHPGMPIRPMPPMGLPHGHQQMAPPPPPPSDETGPPSKRPREEMLMPEKQWMQRVPGQITVVVSTPQNEEWNLQGQTFNVQLDISSAVSILSFYE